MQVSIRGLRHVVVEDNVDSLYVHASSKQVSSHHDSSAEALEGLVLGQSVVAGGWICFDKSPHDKMNYQ